MIFFLCYGNIFLFCEIIFPLFVQCRLSGCELAPLFGRTAGILPEDLAEIALVKEAALLRNLRQRDIAGVEHFLCLFHAQPREILEYAHTHLFFEDRAEICFTDMRCADDLIQRDLFIPVGTEELDRL